MTETLGGGGTLEHRTAVVHVLLLYKILNCLVAIDPGEKLCKQSREIWHLKPHNFKKIQCKTESHRLSFYPRTIEQWNSLPEDIISQVISIVNLKTQISKHVK